MPWQFKQLLQGRDGVKLLCTRFGTSSSESVSEGLSERTRVEAEEDEVEVEVEDDDEEAVDEDDIRKPS